MRNSSQNAGCMRRSPASHCCQVRQVVCSSTPAAVCDNPAASRAARTSAGSGFVPGPFGPRFGWLGTFPLDRSGRKVAALRGAQVFVCELSDFVVGRLTGDNDLPRGRICVQETRVKTVGVGVVFGNCQHFRLQPLLPRGAVGKQCASHELNYTRNARKRKNLFELFFGGCGETAKPSNAELCGGPSGPSERAPG